MSSRAMRSANPRSYLRQPHRELVTVNEATSTAKGNPPNCSSTLSSAAESAGSGAPQTDSARVRASEGERQSTLTGAAGGRNSGPSAVTRTLTFPVGKNFCHSVLSIPSRTQSDGSRWLFTTWSTPRAISSSGSRPGDTRSSTSLTACGPSMRSA